MTDKQIQLFRGNCLDVIKTFPDDLIDLTVTSPPYDNLRDYEGYVFDFEGIAKELFRITKQGGVVVWVVGDATIDGSETGTSFRQALYFKEIGFNLHDTMIYKSKKPPLTHKRYEQCFEYMFILSKKQPNAFNPILKLNTCRGANIIRNGNWASGKQKSAMRQKQEKTLCKQSSIINNIWVYRTGGNTEKDISVFQHPAIFPLKLAYDHIISWSNPGDLVLDPMCGSGTTGVACVNTKRRFIGIETGKKYYKIAKKRIRAAEKRYKQTFQL